MKSVIYSPYLNAFGGGERYILTIAEYLLTKGEVYLLWHDPAILSKLADRFHLTLEGVQVLPIDVVQKNSWEKYQFFHQYDCFVYLSDGSFPAGFAKKNIMHMQIPFDLKHGRSLRNRFKLRTWQAVIVNSALTKSYVDQSFGIQTKVIYPPVAIGAYYSGTKEPIIINVGRFHGKSHGKKQEVLIDTFKKIHEKAKNWKLILIGSVENEQYYRELQRQSKGYPIELYGNLPFCDLVSSYARASIYWHAQGYGEVEPKYQEHFGMTTVEAMAAGCVPVAFGGGGQKEIIEEAKNGFLWYDEDDLVGKTLALVSDSAYLVAMAKNGKERSQEVSKEQCRRKVDRLLGC